MVSSIDGAYLTSPLRIFSLSAFPLRVSVLKVSLFASSNQLSFHSVEEFLNLSKTSIGYV